MIIEFLFNCIVSLTKFIFSILPATPDLPAIKAPFEGFKIIVGKGLRLLGVFLDVSLFKSLVVVVLSLIMIQKVYSLVMYIKEMFKF